ncbi:MAG: ABC transporter ATP-binding protein [Rubrivivax sp.]|nr:ABC transporter ATP-binding protein [Rubrivivax sp.]MBK7261452.1 ABC transporter ATP-binding protein [Rubrivivax sp.]MBK8529490.1 ABC transporter ATP-binding protein [Rubrivivax sp.]
MTHLVLDKLNLAYGKSAAVTDLNLSVAQGQLISLLGPSGCGKTTTMRAVAGLLRPVSGRIVLAGEDITQRPVHQRDMGLVFQSYALFPHLSAYDNVAFGLRLRKVAAAELDQRVRSAIASVGLQGFESRLPANLSGGQQQRVAVARAIVLRPRLLLLDEPLSNLDALLRVEMRAELRRIQRELGITMLYVTHDQEEALSLSDRIVVMRDGRIEQDDSPEAVYHHPATPFVATFMGYQNLFDWHDGALCAGDARVPLAVQRPARHLAWRPEHVAVGAPGSGTLDGRVLARSYLGERIEFLVHTALGPVKGCADLSAGWREGADVGVRLDPAQAALI